MSAELTAAVIIGLGSKLIARIQAANNDLQIISARAYESQQFGRDFPQHGFDPFSLPTEFVVVESFEGAVIKERFYTVLGSFYEAVYRDGQYRGNQYFALSSPLYFCMVFVPCIVGFLGSILLPVYGTFLNPLLCSGVLWMMLTFFFKFAANYRRRR